MPLDSEITKDTTALVQYVLSFHRLSEAFFAALPHDMPLCEAEWEAIEHTVLEVQHAVNTKVGHLLDAFNALRVEWTDRQWEGVVLGLLLARRFDLLSTHPLIENAWVCMQAQQVLQQYPPDRHTEPGGP